MKAITITPFCEVNGELTDLPASKSISNRALLCNALANGPVSIENLATASDTQRMQQLLLHPRSEMDVGDAGTAMRFLTAYVAIRGLPCMLTGSARMQERPIGVLVDALRALGAEIDYVGREGFPPMVVRQFQYSGVQEITISGNVSSQYISALMMVAPLLPRGLVLRLEGAVKSIPYIHMTAALMAHWGVCCGVEHTLVRIPPGVYKPSSYVVEPDWSSLSYWWAWVSMARKARLTLVGVAPISIQGDRAIVDMMEPLGVCTKFEYGNVHLSKTSQTTTLLELDFSNNPDLAQTVIPVCALKGVSGRFSGLESLRIKETDRIAALQSGLGKVGASLHETSPGVFSLTPAPAIPDAPIRIATYDDHRMAMGFSAWGAVANVTIENPAVVRKSYPDFWDHLNRLGVQAVVGDVD